MFGSAILETGLGLLFIYFVLSTVSSSLSEGVARFLGWRAKNLKAAIENMLQNENLVTDFFQNDLIRSLGDKSRKGLPSYMRSKDFARGILSVIAEKDGQLGPLSVQRIQTILSTGRPEVSMIKKGMSVLVSESGMDFGRLSTGVEEWYNSVMERASGWYKRKVSTAILVIASVLTVGANADTIMMLNILYSSSSTRASVVALTDELDAETPAEQQGALAKQAYGVMNQSLLGWSDLQGDLEAAQIENPLPVLGRVERRPPAYECASGDSACVQNFAIAWLMKIVGLILTVAAISMGAPFWFDLLNRVSSLRSSGGRPLLSMLAGKIASMK
ncbi:MAG: hypothetical protein NXI24_07035 [bacterium]|nr:hypothetical protein [bacterium]